MLMVQKHSLFLEHGNSALEEIREINVRLSSIRGEVAGEFPLDDAGVLAHCEDLRSKILAIRDIERVAIRVLKETMA